MILYTVMDHNYVMNNGSGYYDTNGFTDLVEVNYNGIQLLCKCGNEPGTCYVERIISTKPSDYLDSSIQPGSLLKLYK